MSSPSIQPAEIRAAAEVHHELGPDYRDAVIDSFLEKVGREIDARVDARVAGYRGGGTPAQAQAARTPAEHHGPARAPNTFLAVASIIFGIPLTAIVMGNHGGLAALLIIWAAIAVINLAHAVHRVRSDDH